MCTPDCRPEFCPNPACRFHDRAVADRCQWFYLHGHFHTRCRGPIQRFRCRSCGRCCSTQTFSLHYWTHYTNDPVWLLERIYSCEGLRQMGRMAGVTHRVIQNRCRRLARNALAVMDAALAGLRLEEHLALDGFESYTRSHYHPNHITHLTGCRSQFLYAAVHTLFRRKGAMRAEQKRMRALIDLVWRPTTTIGEQTRLLMGDLAPPIDAACERRRHGRPLEIRSDEHPAYPSAIRSARYLGERFREGSLVHATTSSRLKRDNENPLFAVNYVDRQMRKNLAEHVRRTVRPGREVNAQMERTAIFMVLHNFLTPHRIDGKARPALAVTHATEAGVDNPRLRWLLRRMTTHRHLYTHTGRMHWWIRRIWLRLHENPPSVRLSRKHGLTVRKVALAPAALPAYLLA